MSTVPDAADATGEQFLDLASELHRRLPQSAVDVLGHVADALPDWRIPRGFDLGPEFEGRLREAYRAAGDSGAGVPDVSGVGAVDVLGAALVAHLAASLPARLADRRLPPDVAALVPGALDRLLHFLRSADLTGYRLGPGASDFFVKDLRFVAGLTVPCGAGVVDLRGVISRRRTLDLVLRRRSIPAALALARGRSLEPWSSFHVEARYLEEFDEAGWDRAYVRMASLLQQHPEVRGITAGGWLYDPQLATISPRLGHFFHRPLERGAIAVRFPPSPIDVAWATEKSASRRRLHDEGRYTPDTHTMLWPRRQLLAWAERQS